MATQSQYVNELRLGYVLGLFDPENEVITPACEGNVGCQPSAARVFLRHVLRDIAAHPVAGPVFAELDLDDLPALGSLNFRIGMARAATGRPMFGGPKS